MMFGSSKKKKLMAMDSSWFMLCGCGLRVVHGYVCTGLNAAVMNPFSLHVVSIEDATSYCDDAIDVGMLTSQQKEDLLEEMRDAGVPECSTPMLGEILIWFDAEESLDRVQDFFTSLGLSSEASRRPNDSIVVYVSVPEGTEGDWIGRIDDMIADEELPQDHVLKSCINLLLSWVSEK